LVHLITHKDTHTQNEYGPPGGGISPTQRPRTDYIQHSQETNIHVPEGCKPATL